MKTKNIVLIVAVILISIAIIYSYRRCNKIPSKTDTVTIEFANALQDSIRILLNKDSSSTATISVLQTEKASSLRLLKTSNAELNKLQSIVKDYDNKLQAGNSVTNALIETLASLKNKSTVIEKDTVFKDKFVYIYPEYRDTSKNNKWLSYIQRMNRDSSFLDLKVNNEFSVVIGTEKRKPFADLILENPYSATKSLRVYQVKLPPPKRWGIGFSACGTINSKFLPTPYIGVGINYNLIRF